MPYDLKTISFEKARKALDQGAVLTPIQTPFYSGGEAYTHTLSTNRGTIYRVARRVVKALGVTSV